MLDTINILYTTDHTYIKPMLVSLYSLLENNQDINVIIYIVCDKFELEDYKKVEYIINKFKNSNVYFHRFEKIKKIIEEYEIPNWKESQIANARVFFTSSVKDVDKLLYLDSDTIVVDSLSGLDQYDDTIHMVQDLMSKSYWKNLDSSLDKYCNSGVIWIDVDKWKENKCDNKVVDAIKSDINYTYPDQDLLNIALKDDIELLPPEYDLFSIDAYYNNFLLQQYYKRMGIERYSKVEMKNAKESPIILHATPLFPYRAWEVNNIHPYSEIYDEYLMKIFGDVNKSTVRPNILKFKMHSLSNIILPVEVKESIKKFIKHR